MTTYDWIVIGAGITGASLAYELSCQNFKVLLVEQNEVPDNATTYSYGGLAYWSGTNKLTNTLAKEGITLHRNLSKELNADTEFRELDLVLTIDRQDDPQAIASNYQHFAVTPELLGVQEACLLEPLLNPNAISGVLKLPHGHINTQKTAAAYLQGLLRNGGKIIYQAAQLWSQGETIRGIKTVNDSYQAAQTVVCAGGLSRSLLKQAGVEVNNWFTHAQLIRTPPVELELATIVMPAVQERFALEASTQNIAQEPSAEFVKYILDAGAVQFADGSLCLGQISALTLNPHAKFNLATAETQIRRQVGNVLPLLEEVPGVCHSCLVAFNNQAIALAGKLPHRNGLYIFSGFTSTLLYAPALARRFARWCQGSQDQIMDHLQANLA